MELIERPDRAMLVIPHPDDGESGCAGTIAKWVAEGTRVLYVVCTNGDKGTSDPGMTRERLAEIREREQREAMKLLGVQEAVFLGYGDGELEDTWQFREQLVRQIRRFKPDVVLAIDPHRTAMHNHRDHRVSGQAALDACYPYARDRLHFQEQEREGLESWKVGTVLLWGSDHPDVVSDIGGTIDIKAKALARHESQLSRDPNEVAEWIKGWARRNAERVNGNGVSCEYAEIFRKISFRR
ncbi:MAG: PIG-L family deacetylase [SAR202 cluster bacterium]|nr:PIG-L family deacetylase [SAR202 cluster bacterium]